MPTQKWMCEQCGASFDSHQDASDCERSHKSRAKHYRGTTPAPLEDTSLYLVHESEQEMPCWGCHINISSSDDIGRYPGWVKSLPCSSSWGRRGLVIWDRSIQTVAYIRFVDAVELLTELQTKSIETPTIVGERRMIYLGNRSEQQSRYTLANTISLDAVQANELLRFLQANEPLLQKLAAEDAEQWQQALRSAYKVFIESYLRRNR